MVALYTPCFRIEINGVDKTRDIWKHIESVEYDDAEDGESDSLSFTVANDPPFAIPQPGAHVQFWLGWSEADMIYFGSFIVDESSIELKPAALRVSAKSADFNGHGSGSSSKKERKDKGWDKRSLADITAMIAAEHGYKSKVEVDVFYPHVAQTGESDLSFLRRLAYEAGAAFSIKDNAVLIYPPDRGSRKNAVIKYKEAVSGSFTMRAREDYGEVETVWWDKGEASEKRVSSKRKSSPKWWEATGGQAPQPSTTKRTIKRRFNSASEAASAAENHMKRLERGEFTGDLTMPGNPEIVAGAEITLKGFKPEGVNGKYMAKSVNHSVSRSGWITRVSLESLG